MLHGRWGLTFSWHFRRHECVNTGKPDYRCCTAGSQAFPCNAEANLFCNVLKWYLGCNGLQLLPCSGFPHSSVKQLE